MPELYNEGVHLVLLEPQWRSPTYTVLERRTDFYAVIMGMCIPNTDDKTGRENKWCGIIEKLRETHRRGLHSTSTHVS
jgi:hypothetical protein